jgi:hypothetical protein
MHKYAEPSNVPHLTAEQLAAVNFFGGSWAYEVGEFVSGW